MFGGKYYDLATNWFYNVGTIIITTMIINIATPVLFSLFFALY